MKKLLTILILLLSVASQGRASLVETTLWEDTYTDGVELNAATVATFKAGDVLRVYVTVPEGGANFKIFYKGESNDWKETAIPSVISNNEATQWPWVNGGSTYYDVTLTAADITALSGKNIYIYKGDNSTITKVSLITEVSTPSYEGTIIYNAGDVVMGTEWSQYISLTAGQFTELNPDAVIRVYVKDVAESDAQAVFQNGSWQGIDGVSGIDLTSTQTYYELTLTSAVLAIVKSSGLIIKGKNFTATAVTITSTGSAAVTQYTLTVTEPSNGSIAVSTDGGTTTTDERTFDAGTVVSLAATPTNTESHEFDQWTSPASFTSGTATDATVTVTMNEDITATATFKKRAFTITAAVADGQSELGTAIVTTVANSGEKYEYGTEVTVTATPTGSNTFKEWTVGGTRVSTDAAYTFTATEDRALVASFNEASSPVTKDVNYDTFESMGESTYNSHILSKGGSMQLYIDESNSGVFGNKLVVKTTSDSRLSVQVYYVGVTDPVKDEVGETARSIYAVTLNSENKISKIQIYNWNNDASVEFSSIALDPEYTLAYSSNDNTKGSVAVSSSKEKYTHGESVTLTATANSGYLFSKWKQDDVFLEEKNSELTITLTGSTSFVGEFVGNTSLFDAGASDIKGESKASYNSETKVMNVTEAGNGIQRWIGDASTVGGSAVVLRYTPSASLSINVEYTDGSADNFGYKDATERILKINSAKKIKVLRAYSNTTGDITFSQAYISSDAIDGAEDPESPAVTKYKITVAAEHGTIKVVDGETETDYNADTEYESGTSVTLKAYPAENYTFTKWQQGTTESTDNPYTVTIADADVELTAVFTENQASTPKIDEDGNVDLAKLTANDGAEYNATTYIMTATEAWKSIQLWLNDDEVKSGAELVVKFAENVNALAVVTYQGTDAGSTENSTSSGKEIIVALDKTKNIQKIEIKNSEANATIKLSSITLNQTATPATYEVTITAPENGAITVKNGEAAVSTGDMIAAGTLLSLKAEPASSYKFTKWTSPATLSEEDAVKAEVTLTMPDEALTITASFEAEQTNVPAFSLDGFTANDGNSYDASTHTLTVTNAWSGGQLWIGEHSTYSGSKLVIKTTEDSKLKVLVGYVGGGDVNIMDSEATKKHTLEIDNTKKIEKVIIQNQTAGTVTFTEMALDPSYTLTITAPDNGSFTVNDGTNNLATGASVAYGTTLTLTATANDDYSFTKWTVDGTDYTDNPKTVTLTGATTIAATFTAVSVISPVFTDGVADLSKFEVQDAEKVTYDTESHKITVTEGWTGVQVSATTADNVQGKELRITFSDAAKVKATVKYADETATDTIMGESATILYMVIDGTKKVSQIQIQPTDAGSVTLNEVKVNAESTKPADPVVTPVFTNGVADLSKFEAQDAGKVTYDTESHKITVTDGWTGVQISATTADNVQGKELRITFSDAAKVKATVKYADETATDTIMADFTNILYMVIDGTKKVSQIQIQPTDAGSVTLSEVIVNAESTKPSEPVNPDEPSQTGVNITLDDLNEGWNSTYDVTTKTIDITSDWGARGWYIGDNRYNSKGSITVKFEAVNFGVTLKMEYTNVDGDSKDTSASAAADETEVTLDIPANVKTIDKVYITYEKAASLKLTAATVNDPVVDNRTEKTIVEKTQAIADGDIEINRGLFSNAVAGDVLKIYATGLSDASKIALQPNDYSDCLVGANWTGFTESPFTLKLTATLLEIVQAKSLLIRGENFTFTKAVLYTEAELGEAISEGGDDGEDEISNADASEEAKKVFNVLKNLYGKKIVSGVVANVDWNTKEAENVYGWTGKYPAMNVYDYINLHASKDVNSAGWVDYSDITTAKNWWKEGGIVGAMWHWQVKANNGTDYTCTPGTAAGETSFDASKVYVEGTSENTLAKQQLDQLCGYLKKMQDAGIPVVWRPLHEASGNVEQYEGGKAWFWWGAKGADVYKQLWQWMYNYMVKTKGLNNLIWVWTSQTKDNNWYPGDAYVDIIGRDNYGATAAALATEYEELKGTYPNKMITLSECGNSETAEMAKLSSIWDAGSRWSWFMTWYDGDYNDGKTTTHKHADKTWWSDAVGKDYVVTRDQMKELLGQESSDDSQTGVNISLDDLNEGWSSTYDATTKTITTEGEWAARGWYIGDNRYNSKGSITVKFEAATFGVTLKMEYTNTSGEDKSVSAGAAAGETEVELDIPADVKTIEKVYITYQPISKLKLTAATVNDKVVDNRTEKTLVEKSQAIADGDIEINRGLFSNAEVGDVLRIYATGLGESSKIALQTNDYSDCLEGANWAGFTESPFILKLTATLLEKVQAKNLLVRGENFTFTKATLFTEKNLGDEVEDGGDEPDEPSQTGVNISLDDLNDGWSSTYDATTKTITTEGEWAARGWYIGDNRYNSKGSVTVKFEAVNFGVTLKMEYTNTSGESKSVSAGAAAGETGVELDIPADIKTMDKVYITYQPIGTLKLTAATVNDKVVDNRTEKTLVEKSQAIADGDIAINRGLFSNAVAGDEIRIYADNLSESSKLALEPGDYSGALDGANWTGFTESPFKLKLTATVIATIQEKGLLVRGESFTFKKAVLYTEKDLGSEISDEEEKKDEEKKDEEKKDEEKQDSDPIIDEKTGDTDLTELAPQDATKTTLTQNEDGSITVTTTEAYCAAQIWFSDPEAVSGNVLKVELAESSVNVTVTVKYTDGTESQMGANTMVVKARGATRSEDSGTTIEVPLETGKEVQNIEVKNNVAGTITIKKMQVTTINVFTDGEANLSMLKPQSNATYDTSTHTLATTKGWTGATISPVASEKVSGKELLIEFKDASKVKVSVKYHTDEEGPSKIMDKAATSVRLALDNTKNIQEISIQPTEAAIVTFTKIAVNSEETDDGSLKPGKTITLWENADGETLSWNEVAKQDDTIGEMLQEFDELLITVSGVSEDCDWPKLFIRDASSEQAGNEVLLNDIGSFPYTVRIVLTEDMADLLKNGFSICGDGVTVTKLEVYRPEAPKEGDIHLADLNYGYNSSYDKSTYTITTTARWAARGWEIGDKRYNDKNLITVKFEPVDFPVTLKMEYTTGVQTDQATSVGVPAGRTELLLEIPKGISKLDCVYIIYENPGSVKLTEVSVTYQDNLKLSTAIQAFEAEGVIRDGRYDTDGWYNLRGQRIPEPKTSGIYIHGGKKVVIY